MAITTVLMNASCIGGGGVYTVARELTRHVAEARRDWDIHVLLVRDQRMHTELAEEAFPENVRFAWLPAVCASPLLRAVHEKLRMNWLCQSIGADVVVQLNGMPALGAAIPVVSHCGDPWPYLPDAWQNPLRDAVLAMMKRRAHRMALAHSTAMTWTSQFMRDLVTRDGQLKPKLGCILYNGVPDAWIRRAGSRADNWCSRPLEILTVSNVAKYKRQENVIRALPALRRNPLLKKLRYRIVGDIDRPLRHSLAALANVLGVGDAVSIEGRISNEALVSAYSTAKCFVLPSICESFGIPVVEAMSFGVPVVASSAGALPEICGDAAVLTPPDDITQLARSIGNILTDKDVAQELIARGRNRVMHYRWAGSAQSLIALIEKILRN